MLAVPVEPIGYVKPISTLAGGGLPLAGKVALVTGATRGLGREMSLTLANAGADLIVSSRKQSKCDQLADEVRSLTGRTVLAHSCHVGHWSELEALVDAAYGTFGRMDILINNAGMSPLYPSLSEVTEELFDKVIAINLRGPFRLSALVGDRMHAVGAGVIINISSVASVSPNPDALPYAAAKAGLNALTRGLAAAYGPAVRVNAILPGPFDTDVSAGWDEEFRSRVEQYPLRRIGAPTEIVGAVLFLASDASSFVTGSMITVDGGMSATPL